MPVTTNAKTRESRLFRSARQHVFNSTGAIVRGYIMYKPYAIFTFLASWDEFSWALTTINDPHKRTLPIAIALFQGQNSTLWGLVFAASIIAVLPVIAIFLIFQRHFVSGLTSGAVKG